MMAVGSWLINFDCVVCQHVCRPLRSVRGRQSQGRLTERADAQLQGASGSRSGMGASEWGAMAAQGAFVASLLSDAAIDCHATDGEVPALGAVLDADRCADGR